MWSTETRNQLMQKDFMRKKTHKIERFNRTGLKDFILKNYIDKNVKQDENNINKSCNS